MTIGQAMDFLQRIALEHGNDIPLCSVTETSEGFAIEYGRIFDVLVLPCSDGHQHLHCAFMNELVLDAAGTEFTEMPRKVQKSRKHLKLIKQGD